MQFIYSHGGVFPVRRGARDEETFITAETILARGGAVAMYCEGGRSRTGKVGEQAKRGIGRLALESGAPVVPIAIHGSSRIRNWKRLQFPKITIQYGEPIRWEQLSDSTREQQQAVADEILTEIRGLYAGLEEHGRRGILRRVREQRRARRRAPKGAAVA
jgi:1-acyl-sn-glycerol-3-phosphate acyltransferase